MIDSAITVGTMITVWKEETSCVCSCSALSRPAPARAGNYEKMPLSLSGVAAIFWPLLMSMQRRYCAAGGHFQRVGPRGDASSRGTVQRPNGIRCVESWRPYARTILSSAGSIFLRQGARSLSKERGFPGCARPPREVSCRISGGVMSGFNPGKRFSNKYGRRFDKRASEARRLGICCWKGCGRPYTQVYLEKPFCDRHIEWVERKRDEIIAKELTDSEVV